MRSTDQGGPSRGTGEEALPPAQERPWVSQTPSVEQAAFAGVSDVK